MSRFLFPVAAMCGSLLATALCIGYSQWLAAFAFSLATWLAFALTMARGTALHFAERARELDGKVPSITSLDDEGDGYE